MTTRLGCSADVGELSNIPLTDDLDDNANYISQLRSAGELDNSIELTINPDLSLQPLKHTVPLTDYNEDKASSVHAAIEKHGHRRKSSAFDDLLFEIYDRWHYGGRVNDGLDSDTYTDLTAESDAFVGRSGDTVLRSRGIACDKDFFLTRVAIESKGVTELRKMVAELCTCISQLSASLVRHLKRRDRRIAAVQSNCDVITAILQASSLKRSVDSKIRFSIEPPPGAESFEKWQGGMKAVAALPMGIPTLFRKKVWLALADNYLHDLSIDWESTIRFTFNEKSNPDDNTLGLQIVKDLHRTGCTGFSGHDNDEQRAMLKRVLLAYARWNKRVGYCQGFNIIAAFILDVMDRREDNALKVMIYLIDHVLPDGYFGNNLRALSVDMAVFRDLLNMQLPQLSRHLNHLQAAAKDHSTGASYEPPLTNVFTMQWFLTLFATCLPKSTALRVWDSILLEGSEILLRTSLAIWRLLQERILTIQSADDFYTSMAELSQEMVDGSIIPAEVLVKKIYSLAPFPLPSLADLREKYTYNITPFSASVKKTKCPSQEDDVQSSEHLKSGEKSSADISEVGPGAYAAHPEEFNMGLLACSERASLDIEMLNRRYKRLTERQQQAHVILAVANNNNSARRLQQSNQTPLSQRFTAAVAPIERTAVVNHLFVSSALCVNNRNRAVLKAPTIAASFYNVDTSAGQRSRTVSISSTIQPVVHSVNAQPSDFSAKPVPDLSKQAQSSISNGSNATLQAEDSRKSSAQVVAVTLIDPVEKADSSRKFKPGDASSVPADQFPAHHKTPYQDSSASKDFAYLQRSRSESAYQEIRHKNAAPGFGSAPKIFRPFPKQNVSRQHSRVVIGMYSDKSSVSEDPSKRRASLF